MNFIEEKILEKGNLNNLKLRFPPNPNFHLHIGHAKSIILNFGLAEKYNGVCNLRFDDTNPSVEKREYVDSIIEDIEWLGFSPDNILFTSDYFEFIYNCAIILIKKGLAYVDDSTSEEIARLKGTPTSAGIDSPYKSRSIEDNLNLFIRMRNGEFVEGSKTLRANIDMSSPNMILRDPIIYRIIENEHHHTGNMWKIYPMYDFAHPLSDYIEGITDSLCTMEFEVHKPLYMWVLENCNLDGPFPEETEFSRLNIDSTVMSKRKLKGLVEDGYVAGWDDPRLPTLSGLRRRGFTPKSIKDFCEAISVTRKESIVSWSLLEECLRKDLNKSSFRVMGVMNPIKLNIINWDKGDELVTIENNPEDSSYGTREVIFNNNLWIEADDFSLNPDKKWNRLKIDGEVRLKGAYVIKVVDYITDDSGNVVELNCTYDPLSKSGMILDRKIKGTIHWVTRDYCIKCEIRNYDKLFNVKDVNDMELKDVINKDSLNVTYAMVEPFIKDIEMSNPIQMIRKGYYILDKNSTIDKFIFNKTVSLKESYS